MTQQLRSLEQIKESIKKKKIDDELKSIIYESIQKCVDLEIKKKIKFDKDDGLTENQRRFIILSTKSKGKSKVTDEGFVDVDGDFDCSGKDIKDFMGIKFGKISGSFLCGNNKLTSLEGAPQEVGGYFECYSNQLTSLEGAPQKIGGYFLCSNNKLTSLVGAPQEVGEGFDCRYNQLTSLEGAPQEVGGYFVCSNNKLTSLEGAPQEVGEYFGCSDNQLTSLVGAPQKVGTDFICGVNKLKSLVGAPQEVGGSFSCFNNQLTSLVGAPQKVGWYFDCRYNKLKSLVGAPQEVGGDFDCSGSLEKAFELIYKKLKLGIPYGVALLASKSKISKKEWDKLDKSSIEGIDPKEADNIEKGGSFLSHIGIL
jgi:hypothetical protein